jgi:hypothetical protein
MTSAAQSGFTAPSTRKTQRRADAQDARLVRLMKVFSALAGDQREAFVDVAVTSRKAVKP